MLPGIPAALPDDVSVGELVIEGVELGAISVSAGHAVAIDWLRVASLDEALRPEGAEVEANLSVGDGRARLHGRISLDDSGWILSGEISANEVPLEGLPDLLGAGGSWRGRLGGAGPVRVVYSPNNGAFSATTRGRWAVDGLGLGLGLAQVDLSGARADWNGTAFLVFSEDAVEGLSVDGEVGLREPRIEIAGVLDVEATELMLRVDASRTPETRVTVDGRIPVLRLNGMGGAFEAVGVEAANLVSQDRADVRRCRRGRRRGADRSDTLDVRLPAGRSIDMEQDLRSSVGSSHGIRTSCPRRQGRRSASTGAGSRAREVPGRPLASRWNRSNAWGTAGSGSLSPRRKRSGTGTAIPTCGCTMSCSNRQ